MVKFITITEHHDQQRLDNFLFKTLKNIPKSHIYKIIRTGQIRVNGKRKAADYRLKEGDELRIPPIRQSESGNDEQIVSFSQHIRHTIKKSILFEDQNLLIINKPAAIPVHGGSGLQGGVIELLRVVNPNYDFLELAHRIDKATSGILVLAKKRKALVEFHQLQQQGKIRKTYLLLVKGKFPASVKEVALPLVKNVSRSGERIVRVDHTGKSAITKFKLMQSYQNASLLEAELVTGRTHQIRVHTAHLGYPIAGDEKYGDKHFNTMMKKQGLNRMFLHAEKIVIPLSLYDKPLKFIAELPKDLQQVLEKLLSK